MSPFQRFTVYFPIFYSLICSILIYGYVYLIMGGLTSGARQVLQNHPANFFISTLLLLIPNIILTFLLYAYYRGHREEENDLILLCISSLTFGTIFSLSTWALFTFGFENGLSDMPVIIYGFPFTFFFGICFGWALGLVVISFRNK